MYRISELGKLVGLSRTALLYYEKIGLLNGVRLENGFRSYSERDVQRIRLLLQLKNAGLSLQECLVCINGKVDRRQLEERLQQLENDIAQKIEAKRLLEALLGINQARVWHESLEQSAAEEHLKWLIRQGFDEKEAQHIRWLSKDMHKHEKYMTDFHLLFADLYRLGPGSEEDTLRALRSVTGNVNRILDMGCGRGASTIPLSQNTSAHIIAIDNEQTFLNDLCRKLVEVPNPSHVEVLCSSISALPLSQSCTDVIWAEGSAYIIGFSNALKKWRHLLSKDGYLVVSELVWQTDNPSEPCALYWQNNYPALTNVDSNIQLAREAGYQLVDTFAASEQAWQNYLQPLEEQLKKYADKMQHTEAWRDLNDELIFHKRYLGEYTYQFFILKKVNKHVD